MTIEHRSAEGRNDQLPMLAVELVSRQVNVIAAPGSVASALAAKAATRIPIVFEVGADPVECDLHVLHDRRGGQILERPFSAYGKLGTGGLVMLTTRHQ